MKLHQQEVVVRFKLIYELPEELQVFVPFREELFEVKRKLQLAYAQSADNG